MRRRKRRVPKKRKMLYENLSKKDYLDLMENNIIGYRLDKAMKKNLIKDNIRGTISFLLRARMKNFLKKWARSLMEIYLNVLSREHALILVDDEGAGHQIEDLQSTNGTKVNGKRVRSA